MGALIKTNVAPFRYSKRNPPRTDPVLTLGWHEAGSDVRDFPTASSRANQSLMMRDEVLELYAFFFCQGGYRQLGVSFEHFLLVRASLGREHLGRLSWIHGRA